MSSIWYHVTSFDQFDVMLRYVMSSALYRDVMPSASCQVMSYHVMLRHARLVSSLCADTFGVLKKLKGIGILLPLARVAMRGGE